MARLMLILGCLLLATPALAANPYTAKGLKDVYYGESLYEAFQGEWFDAVARLDTELGQYRRLDEPTLDPLNYHLDQAEFGVGDFELGYRMHLRAGRAISAVVEGKFADPVRNEAIYRLARLYFQEGEPENALRALERMRGVVPESVRDDVEFLRGEILLATGRFPEAAKTFKDLQKAKYLAGFADYNLGIALTRDHKEQDGRLYLERAGQTAADTPAAKAIRDKANLVLGYKLLDEKAGEKAKLALERVRLSGPFSNRALLGSGWSDASRGQYERALVPWSILAEREVTDPAVQEAMLAVPYAYGKLNIYGKAAALYGKALDSFGKEVDKLGASITSVKEGKFLKALAREEIKQDADWVVKLRRVTNAPETYYLLELMTSHDFQDSLKNYLDLNEMQQKLGKWETDLDAFEDIINQRKSYYQPLLPEIDRTFRQLDSQMRLRMEQKERVRKRLKAMLVEPRPENLATGEERIIREKITRLEQALAANGTAPAEVRERIACLRGVLLWNISTEYDRRLTDTYKDLQDLNRAVDALKKQYDSFVRTRQAATQSYLGYDESIRRERARIATAKEKVKELMTRQGSVLEAMAVDELSRRRERLEQFKITARFAVADSYDRATKAQNEATAAKIPAAGKAPDATKAPSAAKAPAATNAPAEQAASKAPVEQAAPKASAGQAAPDPGSKVPAPSTPSTSSTGSPAAPPAAPAQPATVAAAQAEKGGAK